LASDELISTLYTPQDPPAITQELASFLDVVKALQAVLGDVLSGTQALEAQLNEISLSAKPGPRAKIDTQKWLDTCFVQIHKAAGSFAFPNQVILESQGP